MMAAANGTVTFDLPAAATYTVALLDLAPNCELTGAASQTVVVPVGTTPVSFVVTCSVLERIAFTAEADGNWDIYTSKADGTDMQRLTQDPTYDGEPAWSTIGGIAFQGNRNENTDIYVMSEGGGIATRLTTHPAPDRSPAWSPDGRRIAFASERDGNSQIYVMDADGGNLRRLTTSDAQDTDPAWSPDGRIAFTRGSCSPAACMGDIYVANADGQQLVRLTQTGRDEHPAWSADGTTIAFARLTGCANDYDICARGIMVMTASGANVRALISDGFGETEPSWSLTGSRLLVSLWTCDSNSSCSTPAGIRIVRPERSDPINVITGPALNPVWRR